MESNIHCVIIDDEKDHIDLLKEYLAKLPGIETINTVINPLGAVDVIKSTSPDLIFLDINMPKMNGFDILEELRKDASFNSEIIFTTAHNEFAIRAFEYAAFDYLLKPFDPDRLTQSYNRFLSRSISKTRHKIEKLQESLEKKSFRTHSGIIFIKPEDLIYAEAEGNYTHLILKNQRKETVTMLLGKVQEYLDSPLFFRSHRSYLINLNNLARVNLRKRQCTLIKDKEEYTLDVAKNKIGLLAEK